MCSRRRAFFLWGRRRDAMTRKLAFLAAALILGAGGGACTTKDTPAPVPTTPPSRDIDQKPESGKKDTVKPEGAETPAERDDKRVRDAEKDKAKKPPEGSMKKEQSEIDKKP